MNCEINQAGYDHENDSGFSACRPVAVKNLILTWTVRKLNFSIFNLIKQKSVLPVYLETTGLSQGKKYFLR